MEIPEELGQLDSLVKNISRGGNIKKLIIPIPCGYIVEITDEKYLHTLKDRLNPVSQIINVTATASSKSSLSFDQEVQNILRNIEEVEKDPKKLSKAKKNLSLLESEVNKANPDDRVIRKIMRWASDFSLELCIRISVLLAERFIKPN